MRDVGRNHCRVAAQLERVEAERLRGEAGEGAQAPQGVALTAMINPVIEPLGEEMREGWEACLSLPGLAGRVPRFEAIRYRFTTQDGEAVVREAKGFHARVVQHECDHLDGLLYPMRMTDLKSFGFSEDLARSRPEAAEAVDE